MDKFNPLEDKTWDEFQKTGLVWFVNRILHLFGWVLVMEVDNADKIVQVYPARTTYRGFTSEVEERGYKKVTEYMKNNADQLLEDILKNEEADKVEVKVVCESGVIVPTVTEAQIVGKMVRKERHARILPSGEYVISDPCYVLDRDDYDRLLIENQFFFVANDNGIFIDSKTGLEFCVFSTANGDGVYYDNKGREYSVDASCIGCIPVSMCKKEIGKYSYKEVFSEDFIVKSDGRCLTFGNIVIDTDPADDEEEDDNG